MPRKNSAPRFLNPGTAGAIDPALLLRLLAPFETSLRPAGVLTGDGQVRHSALIALLTDPPEDCPQALLDRIAVIDELGVDRNYDILLAEASRKRVDVGEAPTATDLVAHLLLKCPDAVERLAAEAMNVERRTLKSYFALGAKIPRTRRITNPKAKRLQSLLEEDFVRRKRGCGTRVYPFPTLDGFKVMIRRGDQPLRVATIDPSTGDSHAIAFRPERFDLVTYSVADGELRVGAQTHGDTIAYLTAIGSAVFGEPYLFCGEGIPGRYTLEPLRTLREAALSVAAVEALREAHLRRLVWRSGGLKVALSGDDVFAEMRTQGMDIPDHASLEDAIFRLTPRQGRPFSVRIAPPNRAVLCRESDIDVVVEWWTAMGFVINREAVLHDLVSPLLAGG